MSARSLHNIRFQRIDYDVDQPVGWLVICQCGARFTHCSPAGARAEHQKHAVAGGTSPRGETE